MDIVNRALVRSLATTIVKLEKEEEKQFNPSSVVDVWNTKYDLVEPAQLPTLQKQVTLEVHAERHATTNSLNISAQGMAPLKVDQVFGNLSLAPTGLDIDPEAI